MIIHLAAIASVTYNNTPELYRVNVCGAENILLAAKEAGKETGETGDGILEEMPGSVEVLEEAQQEAEKLSEQTAEELSERTTEDLSEQTTEELSGQRTEKLSEQAGKELPEREAERMSEQTAEDLSRQRTEEAQREQEEAWKRHYRPIDFFA